jgi:hypothetical protein
MKMTEIAGERAAQIADNYSPARLPRASDNYPCHPQKYLLCEAISMIYSSSGASGP